MTDEWKRLQNHQQRIRATITMNDSVDDYVRGNVTTNTR